MKQLQLNTNPCHPTQLPTQFLPLRCYFVSWHTLPKSVTSVRLLPVLNVTLQMHFNLSQGCAHNQASPRTRKSTFPMSLARTLEYAAIGGFPNQVPTPTILTAMFPQEVRLPAHSFSCSPATYSQIAPAPKFSLDTIRLTYGKQTAVIQLQYAFSWVGLSQLYLLSSPLFTKVA